MLEFAEAALKFNIALSSFGAQRMLGMLPIADAEPIRVFQESFYKAGENAKRGFQTNTAMFGAFQFTEKAQSALAGLASDALSLKAFTPAYIQQVATGIAQGSAATMDTLATKKSRTLLKQQLASTFDVISYVNHVDAPNRLSPDGTYPLEEMIAQCYSHGDYATLWYVEGLGERYAEAYMAAGGNEIYDLLTSGKAADADPKIRTMMHAGLGMALAKRTLAALTPWSTHAEFKAALLGFMSQVRQNSIPGYEGAALESLGLVTRTWNGQLVKLISSHLLAMAPDAFEFFWHGAGRAMYFSPMCMLPGLSPWEAADSEPPNQIASLNARAGVAWAFTLVNIRQPEIAANFLLRKSDQIAGNDAYTDGVYSTLIMAGDMVPNHQYVSEFGTYQPKAAALTAWNKYIGHNAGATIDSYRAMLKANNELGEVFGYHNLAEYVSRLPAAEPGATAPA